MPALFQRQEESNMAFPVIKGASYILVHTPDMVYHNGTTQTTEMIANPNSEYLKDFDKNLRTFETAVAYPPNQTYIGNINPVQLKEMGMPWVDKKVEGASRFGKFGEIMPQDEFIGLIKLVDSFGLVMLEEGFAAVAKEKLAAHPLFAADADKVVGVPASEIEALMEHHAEGLYHAGKLVGCVKKAHDIDVNLSAHVMFENLVAKASAVLAMRNMLKTQNINPADINYVIECSEEACGDMNQRGGGNFAKSIAEMCGCVNATGSDTRGFCAAPTHALIQASSLVKAGTFKNVLVVAGGATAKLGMNGKDHVKKGLPIIEDVIGGFCYFITENDGVSPVLRTDIVGQHNVGTGSAPQAVITALTANALAANGLKLTDVDKYSVEMQNPDITKPAGAGDVPEANYKMIAALAVMRKEIERAGINEFIEKHGMVGWAPTQGHIPSGVPYLGFAREDLTTGNLNRVMIVGKGSLFLGRMTNLFDGVSIVVERNRGQKDASEAVAKVSSEGGIAKRRIGLTLSTSEHGNDNLIEGAKLAMEQDETVEVVLIGKACDTQGVTLVEVADDKEGYAKMEQMLDSGELDGCVTMHYNFPIGVSTVGKVITPGRGKEMFLATTTGTSSTHRIEGMVKNAIYGIITAKAMGKADPTVGILNVDGANVVERVLREINAAGYPINFGGSVRADGGAVLRGNDLLSGSVDITVTDTLTGNLLMKMFSSFTTGGSYESSGFGYGPGIGEGYKRLVLILSRASGVPVVANACVYAAKLAKGNVIGVAQAEFNKLNKIGFADILAAQTKTAKPAEEETVTAPDKEVVTEEIAGVDIMELEDAVKALWKAGIYAESGMGCTGPIVLVNPAKAEKAIETLKETGFLKAE